jgi:hypothetical protein
MNPLRLLGVFALVTGSGVLLSEPLLGPGRFQELTGSTLESLWLGCIAVALLGAIAIAASRTTTHLRE